MIRHAPRSNRFNSSARRALARVPLVATAAFAFALAGCGKSAPSWIATPLTQVLQDDPARSGPILERTPMRRWGTPAGFMTGTVVPVDGG